MMLLLLMVTVLTATSVTPTPTPVPVLAPPVVVPTLLLLLPAVRVVLRSRWCGRGR
jgi:hypothetical protein